MELPGANYLYALATISVTFVGFSALILVFRQTIGGKMTSYDSYFTLAFMQAGFIVAGGGLLPQLLAFFEMSHASVWRVSSVIMAIPISLFVVATPGRRRAATDEPIPFYVGLLLLLQFLAGVCLLLDAVGWPVPPNLALFALALTVMLFTTGIAYLIALAHALEKNRDQG
jgi:archaellum biogenesis protein FlaJ (TadC family)